MQILEIAEDLNIIIIDIFFKKENLDKKGMQNTEFKQIESISGTNCHPRNLKYSI